MTMYMLEHVLGSRSEIARLMEETLAARAMKRVSFLCRSVLERMDDYVELESDDALDVPSLDIS